VHILHLHNVNTRSGITFDTGRIDSREE